MKINLKGLSSTIAITAIAALLAGCASSGYEKGEKTASNLESAASEIELGKAQVQTALDALNDLMQKPSEDLRPQYKAFSSDVSKVVATGKRVNSKAEKMSAAGQAYADQWDEQMATISNPDIRARSEARKATVLASLAQVQAQYQQTKASYTPFISDMQDIDKALSLDLTPAGVDSLKSVAAQANSHGVDLIKALDSLTTDFRDLGAKMSPLTPKPAN